MPDVIGLKKDEAKDILYNSGLNVSPMFEYSDSVEKDHIISASAENGTQIKKGTYIDIVVSLGVDNRVVVPEITGQDTQESIKQLKALRLCANVENSNEAFEYIDNQNAVLNGRSVVVSCENEGQKLAPGSSVNMKVSKPSLKINSMDGEHIVHSDSVIVKVCVKNISDKVIKYITFNFQFFNQVGDKAVCSVKETNKAECVFTGPLNPGEERECKWRDVIYNRSAMCVALPYITVEFMDGSQQKMMYGGYVNFWPFGNEVSPNIEY